jgi:hypothetical protein
VSQSLSDAFEDVQRGREDGWAATVSHAHPTNAGGLKEAFDGFNSR